jgi:hypothetical protein
MIVFFEKINTEHDHQSLFCFARRLEKIVVRVQASKGKKKIHRQEH